MGSTPEELNTEIAGTREALATNMDALQDRVSPQAIMDRRKAAVRSRVEHVRSRVMGSPDHSTRFAVDESGDGASALQTAQDKVEGSPLAAGMMAFFAGILVSAALPATHAEGKLSRKAIDAAKEHGQPVADAAKSAGQEVGTQLKESASHAAQDVKGSAHDSVERVKDEGQESLDTVHSQAQH